jgi:hypothetical protein
VGAFRLSTAVGEGSISERIVWGWRAAAQRGSLSEQIVA